MRGQIQLTSQMIHGFVSSVLMSRFDTPQPTPDCHLEWWDLVTQPHRKVAIAAPRGHAKSTAITHSFVLAAMLFRYRDHAMIVSDTEDQAIAFLGDIKIELLENDMLREMFGVHKFSKDRESEVVVIMNDGHKFRIIARGSNQKLRGLKWRNKRPNLIVGDDLENDEMVMNEERRDKFRQWFYGALLPAGSDDCIFRIVGTILHLDAMLERLMPQIGAASTIDLELKSISTDNEKVWKSVRYRAHNEDFSAILWPEKFSKKRLMEERQDYVDQGFPEGYAQEYLNYPIDDSISYYKKADFLPITNPDEPLEYYVGVDLAISEKDKRAFTVMSVVGVNAAGLLKVKDVRRFRGDSLEIINALFSINSRWNPEVFFIEQENIARSIGPVLNKEMANKGYLSIEPIVPTQDKIKRGRSFQARMRAGMVEWDTEAEWYPQAQTEMLQFPRGQYKDIPDSFALIGLGLDKIIEAPTRQQLLDMEWEEEYEDTLVFQAGRSRHTGY